MLDRETGRSKGFGFVSLENADVDSILGFGKLEIDGKLASSFYTPYEIQYQFARLADRCKTRSTKVSERRNVHLWC
jgi:hypothetical protein